MTRSSSAAYSFEHFGMNERRIVPIKLYPNEHYYGCHAEYIVKSIKLISLFRFNYIGLLYY